MASHRVSLTWSIVLASFSLLAWSFVRYVRGCELRIEQLLKMTQLFHLLFMWDPLFSWCKSQFVSCSNIFLSWLILVVIICTAKLMKMVLFQAMVLVSVFLFIWISVYVLGGKLVLCFFSFQTFLNSKKDKALNDPLFGFCFNLDFCI